MLNYCTNQTIILFILIEMEVEGVLKLQTKITVYKPHTYTVLSKWRGENSVCSILLLLSSDFSRDNVQDQEIL